MSCENTFIHVTESNPLTIHFNVGGKHYEVSKSLVEQQADGTMLSRIVSDAWHGDPNEPVFIDRDGERFGYCLDYLRYGKVSLPITVPLGAWLRDMDFYGFQVDKLNMWDVKLSIDEDEALSQSFMSAR